MARRKKKVIESFWTRKKYQRKPKQIKRLDVNHFVRYRTKNGYVKRRPKGEFVLEVFDRKTKKRVGVMNRVKNGIPLPRKFTATQIVIKKARPNIRRVVPRKNEIQITLTSSSPIKDQLQKNIKKIRSLLTEKQNLIAVHIDAGGGVQTQSPILTIDKKASDKVIVDSLTITGVLDTLNVLTVRMSPKKESQNKGFNAKRKVTATIFKTVL